MQKQNYLAITALSLLSLTACMSSTEMKNADTVIEAKAEGVKKCLFIGDVDANPRLTLTVARQDLKHLAYSMGATHLVETMVYTAQVGSMHEFGVGISGRAYYCDKSSNAPQETKANALLPYERKLIPVIEPDFF